MLAMKPTCGSTALAEFAGASAMGRSRVRNEDRLGVVSEADVFVVADGCGGNAPGDLAAEVAVDAFRGFFAAPRREPEVPCGEPLAAALHLANLAVIEAVASRWERTGMGCTLAALRLGRERDAVVHAGDCRVYRVRDDKLLRMTLDHDLTHMALRQGHSPSELGEAFRIHSTMITAALGFDRELELDLRYVAARPGDLYLLCSDGLSRRLSDPEIVGILALEGSLEARVRRLVDEVGDDDTTALLVRRLG